MNIGDIVYYYEHWSDSLVKAKIESIYQTGLYAKQFNADSKIIEDVAKLKTICTVDYDGEEICSFPGSCDRRVAELYTSAESAYDAHCIEQSKRIKKYCNEINTIEDLVKFPTNHCLNGEEYTNNEAYQAYKIKAKELVGIDL